MANEIITTLHPDQDPDINLYPNIKKNNIPNKVIDRNKLSDDVNSLLNSINELHPSGVDTSTHILSFTSNRGIYIGSDTGHWYYWNGTQYVDGGVYQTAVNYDELEEKINDIENTGFNPKTYYLKTERGTFDSTTGDEIDNYDRLRTIDFIPDNVDLLFNNNGILLYAWDVSNNYIGFWGGSGWVTSGSEYLYFIDMVEFRTNYPNYKFKAISQTRSAIYVKNIIAVYRFSYINNIVKNNLKNNVIKNGYLSNFLDGGVDIIPSTTRVYTDGNIDTKIVEIVANDGYLFRVMAMNEDGKTDGNFRTNGTFSLSGSSANLKRFDLSKYNYYGYRLTILKEDTISEITRHEGYSALVFKTEKDLPVKNETTLSPSTIRFLPFLSEYNNNNKNSLCLCALKTPIVDNKIPMHTGFLFHKLPDNDRSIYYGTTLENATKIGDLDYYPKTCVLAISPSGIVIGAYRGDRANLHIWDGTTNYTLFQNADIKPMGWLYNSGVEFVLDNNNVEHCIFAEYDGSTIDKGGFYVWRGTYPYTSESDWERVFHKDMSWDPVLPDTIVHFHMVRKDPFSNVIYLTSGDKVGQLNWWYSTDYGETWNLLINDTSQSYTWEDHILRTINFIFTKDYIYWATDHGTNHCLNKIKRDTETGIIDLSTREKICDLPYACACNSLCYVDSPNGLFMYERIDVGSEYEAYYNNPVPLLFWSFEKNQLFNLGNIKKLTNTWGGHRGKCYVNYTSGQQPYVAMGFSDDTRCIFDIVGADGINIGTIYYDL